MLQGDSFIGAAGPRSVLAVGARPQRGACGLPDAAQGLRLRLPRAHHPPQFHVCRRRSPSRPGPGPGPPVTEGAPPSANA